MSIGIHFKWYTAGVALFRCHSQILSHGLMVSIVCALQNLSRVSFGMLFLTYWDMFNFGCSKHAQWSTWMF